MKYVFGIAILLLGVFLVLPLLHSGLYISHDGINHVARIAATFKAFSDGQLIPRWPGGAINFGYGSPVLIFFYPLPGYLGSLLHIVGVPFEKTFSIIMGLSLLGMGISWYLFAKELFGKRFLAVCSAIIYVVIPYHILDVYVRGDVGEVLSFVFLPLIFWALTKRSIATLLVGSLSYGLLLLSHNVMSLVFTPVIFFYGIFVSSTKKEFVHKMIMLGFGLLLASFFWVPALIESKYLNADLYIGFLYQQHFLPYSQILYSQWGFGPNINQPGGFSAQLGVVFVVIAALSWITFRKNFSRNRLILFWSLVFFVALFLAVSPSNFIWSHIELLRRFQFPWRFVALASFALCIIILYGLSHMSRFFQVLITFVLVASILPFIQVAGYVQHHDSYYTNFSGTTYFHGEATTRWVAGGPSSFARQPLSVISGNATIQKELILSQKQIYSVNAKDTTRFVAHTTYFPGWKVFVDRTKVPIEFQDMNYRGLITFYVPKGVHTVSIMFGETPIRLFADILSLIGIAGFITLLLFHKKLL